MTANGILQVTIYLFLLTVLAIPLGAFMAHVYEGRPGVLGNVLGPVEHTLYRLSGIEADEDMTWKRYAGAVLLFNLLGMLVVYGLLRLQAVLPLNPDAMPAIGPEVSFNTAVSFATNTNWQAYGGEATMSYLAQMLGLAVQNFVSAATGLAVLGALVRGFTRKESDHLGSFWVDLTRMTLYVLTPLSVVLALFLVSQGVVQTFSAHRTAQLLDPYTLEDGQRVAEQILAVGPAASQVAIKQLGTNGGGFFNANSAHPFENSTALSNFVEALAILLIPGACCFAFGRLVRDRRQGVALYAAMMALLVPLLLACVMAEQSGNPLLGNLGADQAAGALQTGGNMEGKEVRHGVTNSALWATVTTAASNGSVNAMHDSFTPLGGLVPLWLIQLGEVVFGGVGSGLYGMVLFAIFAVFIAGLMVGRTPEYLGKKIEAYEMKMASLGILAPCATVLVATALACVVAETRQAVLNPGAHGFSEILYAFSSMGNNNGSAFAGLTASGSFYAAAGGLCMLVARFWVIIPVLAIAGSLAKKKSVPVGPGTLPTHTPLFVGLLAGTVVLIGALTFIPALALGPIVEHLELAARK